MSMVRFTSDIQFDRPKVAEARGFGPSTAMHDATITQRWNDTVRPDDQVRHPGDATTGHGDQALHLIRKLHGQVNPIIGSHGRVWPGHRPAHCHQREWLGVFRLLHGHVHDAWQVDGCQINVVDRWDLTPNSPYTTIEIIEENA
jgi:calcineurin-like phosphoesterase family protein